MGLAFIGYLQNKWFIFAESDNPMREANDLRVHPISNVLFK